MRSADEIMEDILAVCYAFEKRERIPFMGTAQLLGDSSARQVLMIQLAPLVEEFSKNIFSSGFAQFMEIMNEGVK